MVSRWDCPKRVLCAGGRPDPSPAHAQFWNLPCCHGECFERFHARRRLVVEDDPIIALDFEDTILGFGVKTVRAAASVTRALKMIEERAPDFVLLDVGLVREKSFAVAERLDALGIPFAFVTGYSTEVKLPAAFMHKPRLPKPCVADALATVLKSYRER
jgi:CheY-like chemotaxis protein